MIDSAHRPATLYVVAVSHLDSQWRWTLRDTVERFLPNTVAANRRAFRQFPSHILSFEGAHRYALLREHHPALWQELRELVAAGRWSPVGAAWEAMDCVIPSVESLFRQILLGQRFFERSLGRRSSDLFLPDCFGFPAALPAIARHAGLTGFSTQKLRLRDQLRAADPIPFPFGIWEGPDGSELLAALDPGGYGEAVTVNLAHDPAWVERLSKLSAAGRPPIAVLFTGIGDKGGALPDASLAQIEAAIATEGPVKVIHGDSARAFLELHPDERSALPRYRGELLLAVHATGGYSSQAEIKRGNREAERVAGLAERSAVFASAFAGNAYPTATLRWSWKRFLAHQMHDTICGTCIPAANSLAWNDQALARARFSQVVAHALAAAARELDTRTAGLPVVVFNPHPWTVEEVVEVELADGVDLPQSLLARDPRGLAHPVQWSGGRDRRQVLFLANLAPLSLTVFSLEPAPGSSASDATEVLAASDRLVNRFLDVRLDREGDLAAIHDRTGGPASLPVRCGFELLRDVSKRFPAWEILHEHLARPARGRFGGPAPVRIREAGPVRAVLESERRALGSTLRTRLALSAGESGRRIEVAIRLDWRSRGHLLKARLDAEGEGVRALYDGGIGVVERATSTPRLYEVPAQAWAALERGDGTGVALLSAHAVGFDHPEPSTLRATLVRTPKIGHRFSYQRHQDLGRHATRFALLPYAGGFADGAVAEQADRFRQRPIAFRVTPHAGPLGRSASLGEMATEGIGFDALKGVEDGEGFLLRLRERRGGAVHASVRFSRPPAQVERVDACERPTGEEVTVDGLRVACEIPAWGVASIRFSLPRRPPSGVASSSPIPFARSLVISGVDGEPAPRGFDGKGVRFPQEQLPRHFDADGVDFDPCFDEMGHLLAASASRQSFELDGTQGDLYLLAASHRGDRPFAISVAGVRTQLTVHDWRGPLAQWDRVVALRPLPWALRRSAFRRRAHVAWVAGHLHDRHGRNLAVEPGTLFRYRVPLPPRPCRVELGADRSVLLVAASLAPRWLAEAPDPHLL